MLSKLLKHARRIWRSSITGKFVSRDYAEAHPDTTTREKVK
jgi:hypothetical protein